MIFLSAPRILTHWYLKQLYTQYKGFEEYMGTIQKPLVYRLMYKEYYHHRALCVIFQSSCIAHQSLVQE
jgi:hypothetical protein